VRLNQRGHKWIKKEMVKVDALAKTAEKTEAHRIMAPKGEVQNSEEMT